MTRDSGYEVDGEDGTYVITDPDVGRTVGVYYRLDDEPGWWRGTVHGRVRRLFLPAVEPLEVATRFLFS
ncbi:hypothetical protein BZB76_1857 [Actinomadura pelletieri DSM 43383]|uniref:Uncharacterized protein n=1 Tax=Actinomadura pelletieri DSM 43383 TaxID=1120940 RepID=A0A495QSW4_9ACTN|nr:hypothetical protein [Actinomadura pelletieri]RKS76501.1 hypothetical protein BZB76_1857 [Actinomadura pelletieri DSM 43383]